jgi:uncharacterized protein (TIGR03000 family)
MFQKTFSFAGILLLAGAALLVTTSPSQAQRGGGHFGGAHFGGAHFGGAHFGGTHFGGAHFGGGHFGRGHFGGFPGLYYGFYPYYNYPSYGSYPYYNYPYDNYYPYSYPYDYGGSSSYDYGSYPYSSPSLGSGSAYYPVAPSSYQPSGTVSTVTPAPSDTGAHLTVNVPAGAEVWFDGTATTSTGQVRQFDSPPLKPGSRYSYEVQARWKENGQEVTQTQQVKVAAGARVNVTFPVPPETTGQPSAVKKD